MGKKNTKYRKIFSLKSILISILILVVISLILLGNIFSENNDAALLSIVILALLWIGTIYTFCYSITGIIKAKLKIAKENKYIKGKNPYIYYRELPNDYGIGVNSLLYDSTIENQKDIVAVILDLCARKYLNLAKANEKYILQILNRDTNELLENEKYVFDHILTNNLKNLNYDDWFMCCLEDGINLGLYNKQTVHLKATNVAEETKKFFDNGVRKQRLKSIIIGILIALFFLIGDASIFIGITLGISIAMLYFVITLMFLNIRTGMYSMKLSAKQMKEVHYKNEIENTLKKTKKGIEELHKLYSFKAFLNDFGKFVDKSPEEVVLWDRYLSYAQAFELTEEIMATGYDKLVNNASFTIDSIDNVTLLNIEVK